MCQIVSGNRGDVDDLPITSLPTRRFPRRPNFVIGNSKDIMLCPVMSKISFPPGSRAAAEADSFQPSPPSPVQFSTTSSEDEEEHSCVICSHFVQEKADAGKKQPQNAEVTLENVFKYVIDYHHRYWWIFKSLSTSTIAQSTPPLDSTGPFACHVCRHSLGYVILPSK